MPFTRPLRLLLAALFLAGAALPARALQLGETKAQTLARHGPPGAEDRGKNLAMYFWEGWSAQLEYERDRIRRLTYRRAESLRETDLAALLASNGGASRWREISSPAARQRAWLRDDGATAECTRERPITITFHGGRPASAPVPSTAPAPTNFPKILTGAPPPQIAAPVASALPLPASRPLPKLPVTEIDPPPAPASVAEPVSSEPPPARAATIPKTPQKSTTSSSGVLPAAILGGFIAMAAALKAAFRRRQKARPDSTVRSSLPPDAAPPPPPRDVVPAGASGLEALRWDQFELLVGEIFHREGCLVELSAALGPDDGIDLTLRRGAETILVQCKHWRASKIAAREMREFYGAMAASGTPRGVFVTTGSFTRDAREFAEGKGIELLDRPTLEARIEAVSKPGENLGVIGDWIEEFRAHARIFDPECPVCRTPMVIRQNRVSGAPFWGCRSFPRCPGKRDPRLDLLAMAVAS